MSKKYLLVCEGPTDILVIDKIAEKISQDIKKTIEIQELSPQKDATSKRYPNHGWEEVRKWCRIYGKTIDSNDNPFAQLVKRRNWEALIKASNADGLIIQLDTDIVEYITDLTYRYEGTTKQSRKRFATNAILDWLGIDNIVDELYLLLSTRSTETWLLATHDRSENVFSNLPNSFDFEEIENIINLLCSINGLYNCYKHNGIEKLSKTNYQPYAKKIVDNLNKVREECEEADKLCNFLETD